MNLYNIKAMYSNKPVQLIPSQKFTTKYIKEDQAYIPRFSYKSEVFPDIPINKPMKFSEKILLRAIKYGMVMLIRYKGAEDKAPNGHERVIYPLVSGYSAKGNPLIRAWHLSGWSVSKNTYAKKIWRMFRADRILSITFTGTFFRLAPKDYNPKDKGMRGGIVASADFNSIRQNQKALLATNKVQNAEEVTLDKDGEFATVIVKDLNSVLDLNSPLENAFINNLKDIDSLRITFLKSVYGNKYVAILGSIGKPNRTVKLKTNKGSVLGTYKVLDSITGDILKKKIKLKGNSEYNLYEFVKKL